MSRDLRDLAGVLRERWPDTFVAEGEGWLLDRLACRSLRVGVWMEGHPTVWPAGWRVVMVPRRFDPDLTIRRVGKVLRASSRERFKV